MANLDYRMRQLIGTTADWTRCNIVLGNGEIGIEQSVDGIKLKVGDGASTWSALPYITGAGGAAVHVGTTPPTSPKEGDLWFDPVNISLSVWQPGGVGWTSIVSSNSLSPWKKVAQGIQYIETGKHVSVGPMPGTPQAFNVNGNAYITANVLANTFQGTTVTTDNGDIKVFTGGTLDFRQWVKAPTATFATSMHAGNVWVDNQGDPSGGSTQVPALLGPTGQIIRGTQVVFGQLIKDADGVIRLRFTSADGSDHDINMMGQTITGLPDATTHPEAYDISKGGMVADSAASVRWVENKFGGITGMNFKGAKDVITGGDAVPTTFKANDWYIVRQDSYNDKGALIGLMSDAWWDLLTPYSKLARTDEQGHQMREVFAGDHLIWADTPNPANSGFAYIENSNHHNRFVSRFGDKVSGVLTMLKRTSAQNARPITYAGHGFSIGCFGSSFVSDNVTYPDGDIFSINAGGGAGASMIEFVTNDGNGTRYHQCSIAGNGSFRWPVSGAAYSAPGAGMLQQKNISAGAHVSSDGANEILFVAKHDSSATRKTFRASFAVRGPTSPEVNIEPNGIINGVSPGVSQSSVVVLSQLANLLDKSAAGGQHTLSQGLNMNNFRITGLPAPNAGTQPVTVDYGSDTYLKYNHTAHTVNVKDPTNSTNCRLINVADPVNNQDAVTLISLNRRLTTTSSGAASAGKIPQLNGAGKIDSSMLNIGTVEHLHYAGALNPTAAAPTNAKQGWFYFANRSGTAHGSFGAGSIHVNTGDMVIYEGSRWHIIANEADLSAVYTKTQSDAKYETKTHATATYETKTHATSTYETKAHATATYETKTHATATYAAKTDVHNIPTGGTAGQVLEKIDGTNYNAHWVTPSHAHGIPAGGTTGQVLEKTNNTNYNVRWVTPSVVDAYTKTESDNKYLLKTDPVSSGGTTASAGHTVKLGSNGKINTNMLPAGLTGGMHIKGAVSPTSTAPSHVEGDAHFVSRSGTLHSSYGLGAIAVNAGDLLVYADRKWHVVANENDLSAVYTKAESDAKYETKGHANSSYVQVNHTGGTPQRAAGNIIWSGTHAAASYSTAGAIQGGTVTSTIGGIHSKHGFVGDDYRGTGFRLMYATPAGILKNGADAVTHSGDFTVNGTTTLNANMEMAGHFIHNLKNPVSPQDAATKAYVDSHGGGGGGVSQAWVNTQLANYLPLAGGHMRGNINMGGQHIFNMADPSANLYAANKRYVDSAVSDNRVKKDIREISYGLDDILKLNPVAYQYKEPEKYGKGRNQDWHHGFIAQDVQQVMPDLVYHDPMDRDDEGNSESGLDILGFDKTDLVPALVNAVKELKAEIDQLKRKLADANNRG